jgi:hypothetical protein
LPVHAVAQAPAEPGFGDRGDHVAHWIRPRCYRGHHKLCARRMLCVDVRWVAAKTVAAVATESAIPVGTDWRRCAHRAGSGVSNTLLPRIAGRKPIGDICKERFPVADSSDQRRSAATRAFLFLEKAATELDTKSGKSGAPNGSAGARPASNAT